MTKPAQMQTVQAENYLEDVHTGRGLGFWRSLYAGFLKTAPLDARESIIEIGAGSPDFLKAVPMQRKAAVDVSDLYRAEFEEAGIEFYLCNLEQESLEGAEAFDVAVCSDVFEHMLHPQKALMQIRKIINAEGILFSHVPNEYSLLPTIGIMLGLKNGLYFHKDQTEWTDPHLRRFTDRGFRAFLEQEFRYNLKITSLRYRGLAKVLHMLSIPVPLCLEGGPTYASTNSAEVFAQLEDVMKAL